MLKIQNKLFFQYSDLDSWYVMTLKASKVKLSNFSIFSYLPYEYNCSEIITLTIYLSLCNESREWACGTGFKASTGFDFTLITSVWCVDISQSWDSHSRPLNMLLKHGGAQNMAEHFPCVCLNWSPSHCRHENFIDTY